VRRGYEVVLVQDACRGIGLPAEGGQTTIDVANARLAALGVTFVNSDAIA
jgi:nicotinamidase/pyrazinamidase